MTSVPVIDEILTISLAAAPWLLLGLLAAGLIKALVPNAALHRWVGGSGVAAVSRAAVIGAPLPLCSCGAIPTALALYRGGAGRGPTTAFLIGTPGIGADSVAITYALLGPVMMGARVLGAIVTAISTGLLVAGSQRRRALSRQGASQGADCCASACKSSTARSTGPAAAPLGARLQAGVRYAFRDLLDDISIWIVAGFVIAGLISWAAPPEVLATYGSGLSAMLLMALIGIPMYICATAATPIAAAMVLAGVSPGTALVFLLAGPITSMATLAVLRREMGGEALARYVGGIIAMSIGIGLLLDQALEWTGVDVRAQIGTTQELLPTAVEWTAGVILIVLAVPPLRRRLAAIGRRGQEIGRHGLKQSPTQRH